MKNKKICVGDLKKLIKDMDEDSIIFKIMYSIDEEISDIECEIEPLEDKLGTLNKKMEKLESKREQIQEKIFCGKWSLKWGE